MTDQSIKSDSEEFARAWDEPQKAAPEEAVTELAFLWHAVHLGLAGADASEREARLVTVLHAAKADLPAKTPSR